jgi:hypothetical protein
VPPAPLVDLKRILKIKALVGAARFELTTPCAQGRFRPFAEIACFLKLRFQADASSLLKTVERFGISRLWAATILTTSEPRNQIDCLSIFGINRRQTAIR